MSRKSPRQTRKHLTTNMPADVHKRVLDKCRKLDITPAAAARDALARWASR